MSKPPKVVSVPLLDNAMTSEEVMAAVVEAGRDASTVELLRGSEATARAATAALSAVIERLNERKRDVEELLSIAKTGSEFARKVDRLAARLLKEEEAKQQ
ncbi:MAG TPA: hypothetical protein VG476_07575 [Acidimicrobiales bacterium]|nr:hypothetical protein [Acidimicrobiales bacterium]